MSFPWSFYRWYCTITVTKIPLISHNFFHFFMMDIAVIKIIIRSLCGGTLFVPSGRKTLFRQNYAADMPPRVMRRRMRFRPIPAGSFLQKADERMYENKRQWYAQNALPHHWQKNLKICMLFHIRSAFGRFAVFWFFHSLRRRKIRHKFILNYGLQNSII